MLYTWSCVRLNIIVISKEDKLPGPTLSVSLNGSLSSSPLCSSVCCLSTGTLITSSCEVESFPLLIVEGLVAIRMKSTNCLSVHKNDKMLPWVYNCYIPSERLNPSNIGSPLNMVPLDTVSTVYHSIYIHELPRKVNCSLVRVKASFLGNVVFFPFLKGCFLIFANIFVISVLKSYTVVMKQRYFKYDLVVSLDL